MRDAKYIGYEKETRLVVDGSVLLALSALERVRLGLLRFRSLRFEQVVFD